MSRQKATTMTEWTEEQKHPAIVWWYVDGWDYELEKLVDHFTDLSKRANSMGMAEQLTDRLQAMATYLTTAQRECKKLHSYVASLGDNVPSISELMDMGNNKEENNGRSGQK